MSCLRSLADRAYTLRLHGKCAITVASKTSSIVTVVRTAYHIIESLAIMQQLGSTRARLTRGQARDVMSTCALGRVDRSVLP